MNRRTCLSWLVLVLAGCVGGGNDGGQEPTATSERTPYSTGIDGAFVTTRALEFVEATSVRDSHTIRLQGTVRNATNSVLDYVSVRGEFMDEDETRIDDGLDNTLDLGAGQAWEYDIVFLGDNPDRVAYWRVIADART